MAAYTEKKLSDSSCKSAQPKEKPYSLPDGGSLGLFVTTKGSKSWRYKYRFAGKYKTLVIGSYPIVSLKEARELRDVARREVSEGIDPAVKKQQKKLALSENSFQAVAEAWIDNNESEWSATHKQRSESYLRRDVFKSIGARQLDDINVQDLIQIVKTVASRGAVDSARRLLPLMGQVFEYGIVHGVCNRNPSRDVSIKSIGLPKTIVKGYAAITDPVELATLLIAADEYGGNISTKVALQLAPMLALRPTELTSGEWVEIDLVNKVWVLPAKRRKLPKHLKEANRKEDVHLVPLPKQAVELLKDLHDYTGRGKYLFPGLRGDSRPISNNTLRVALRGMGFGNDDHTAHGYRHTMSTMLNNMGYRERIIEAQLSHSLKSKVESAYNRASYFEERASMMQEWADYLDSLKAGAEIIPIMNKQV